ncbi:hypothetical protein OG800_50445 (plasmid) [Streptomyces sp. NBC_00445]|uniref:hypothetical protein n=1 Tax=Streptomyces sp. NBC_00445 TaxID=2975745 RepID=UPI002E1C891A
MQHPDALDDVPELKKAVDAVCDAAPSEARRKQIRAHARELVRALRHPDHPRTVADDLADVFNRASLQAFERLALAGELRDRGPVRPTSQATANVRSGVMALLQRELGLEIVHLRTQKERPRITPVDVDRHEERLRANLQAVADYTCRQTGGAIPDGLLTRPYPRWARIVALVSVVLDTGARVGELCALRMDDLSPTLREARITRRPQNGMPQDPDVVEIYRLCHATRAALQRWCQVRRQLMTGSTGGEEWLWPSIRGQRAALQPLGASRTYIQTVTEINIKLAGTKGWEPMPVRMEFLRRGVAEPARVIRPQTPDTERAVQLIERVEAAGRQLAALPATASITADGRKAREKARHALREAWRSGIKHRVQLEALGNSALAAPDFPRAGWNPELLRTLDWDPTARIESPS